MSNTFDWNICRVCIQKPTEEMLSINAYDEANINIKDKLFLCGNIEIEIKDNLPKSICKKCLKHLDTAYKFRLLCQTSSDYFNQYKNNLPLQIPEESLENLYGIHFPLTNVDYTSKTSEIDLKKALITNNTMDAESKNPIEDNDHICNYCGNMYTSYRKLNQHIRIHEDKSNKCEICQKTFNSTVQLTRHMNSHTGAKPYKCKYCESRFADPSTCIKHQRIHTNERPYKCEICFKSFSYSNVLKGHILTHTGEKPFFCDICEKRFSQRHHMNSHRRIHMKN